MRRAVPAVLLLAIGWLTSGPSAQGLGDIARREAERRQQSASGKKYTNEDLRTIPAESVPAAIQASDPASAPAPSSSAPASTEAAGSADPGAAGESPKTPRADVKSAEQKRGEQYWRDKAGAVQSELDKSNAKVEGLRKRLEALEAQLSNGAGSSHVQEREVTLRALEKAEYNAKAMREEWNRLEARAAAAKVPSEWLR
jgi:hypothetical protein